MQRNPIPKRVTVLASKHTVAVFHKQLKLMSPSTTYMPKKEKILALEIVVHTVEQDHLNQLPTKLKVSLMSECKLGTNNYFQVQVLPR